MIAKGNTESFWGAGNAQSNLRMVTWDAYSMIIH